MPLGNHVEMRETFLVAFALAFLLSAIVVSGFVGLAEAYPYSPEDEISPPPNAVPIVISVSSPVNACLYGTSNITFAFNASSRRTGLQHIQRFRCTVDWLPEEMYVYELDRRDRPGHLSVIEYEETYQVPDGKHSLILEAFGPGYFYDRSTHIWIEYWYNMTTTLTVNFTVDTTAPSVSVLSPENKTYDTTNVTLNFTVSEMVSQTSYVLNGGENMTIEGNTTLTGLSNGEHNVTVYATDLAGYIGASETIMFTVEVFPTTLTAVIILISTVAVSAALLFYFKKRQRGQNS